MNNSICVTIDKNEFYAFAAKDSQTVTAFAKKCGFGTSLVYNSGDRGYITIRMLDLIKRRTGKPLSDMTFITDEAFHIAVNAYPEISIFDLESTLPEIREGIRLKKDINALRKIVLDATEKERQEKAEASKPKETETSMVSQFVNDITVDIAIKKIEDAIGVLMAKLTYLNELRKYRTDDALKQIAAQTVSDLW